MTAQERASERWAQQERTHVRKLIADAMTEEKICEECGDDLVCAGFRFCSDCLELRTPSRF